MPAGCRLHGVGFGSLNGRCGACPEDIFLRIFRTLATTALSASASQALALRAACPCRDCWLRPGRAATLRARRLLGPRSPRCEPPRARKRRGCRPGQWQAAGRAPSARACQPPAHGTRPCLDAGRVKLVPRPPKLSNTSFRLPFHNRVQLEGPPGPRKLGVLCPPFRQLHAGRRQPEKQWNPDYDNYCGRWSSLSSTERKGESRGFRSAP
ncbi:uncharacterized protein LOC132656927 [Meriones unguiculatus]|uniref:uncharacterized protein LOC132656927 n=1 Tax=Meriones unguiculatus TaxID=10047 RepID=UPI00293EC6F7|nr:uncharacterized protein LOC132656927 [Meriones unguiculatus]